LKTFFSYEILQCSPYHQTLWVVVTCVLLGKLANAHAPSDHGSQLPSRRLGSLHVDLVASLRPPIREIMAA
jgi:hypothetical protein